MKDPDQIIFYEAILEKNLKQTVSIGEYSSIGGGCIHQAMKVKTSHGIFFVKSNRSEDADMFEKEFQGLKVLRESSELTIPDPLGFGTYDRKSYLITEFIESGVRSADFWERFGTGLAKLHRHHADRFGFDQDNYIGRLPQKNDYYDSWIDFFIEMRLEVQLKIAVDLQRIDSTFSKRFRKFFSYLPDLLPEERPSLLHGDLWSGNFMTGPAGDAVLIDPAVYNGHREIEMSFTRMFGGFDQIFYDSYQDEYPLEPGFDNRVDIYNLYPYLVHVNLFGNSYLGGVERVISLFV
jgi:protein-ribulosamine 3-kinase